MRKILQVSFDIDGVLADFTGAVIAAANELHPSSMPLDYVQRDWNYLDVMVMHEWTDLFAYMLKKENLWAKMGAFEDNITALRNYQQRNRGDILFYFTTARSPSAGLPVEEQTKQWLQAQGLQWEDVVVVTSGGKKAGVYDQFGIDVSLDDLDTTVRQCNVLPRHRAFLLDWPYNRKAYDIPRVKSVAKFLERVEQRRRAL